MPIIFYDIPTKTPGKALSSNTWKTRFCLNYKGIPYHTEWIPYEDIQQYCRKVGVSPTRKNEIDGTDIYTLPAIFDSDKGKYVSDSFRIAQYLDETYPDVGPQIFPNNTIGLQTAFQDASDAVTDPFYKAIVYDIGRLQDEKTLEHFRASKGGINLEDFALKGDAAVEAFNALKERLGKLDEIYAKTDDQGPFLLGVAPSWGDFVLGGHLHLWKRIWVDDPEKWIEVASWHGGRWRKLARSLDTWSSVL